MISIQRKFRGEVNSLYHLSEVTKNSAKGRIWPSFFAGVRASSHCTQIATSLSVLYRFVLSFIIGFAVGFAVIK